jgi:hypothetical protein
MKEKTSSQAKFVPKRQPEKHPFTILIGDFCALLQKGALGIQYF